MADPTTCPVAALAREIKALTAAIDRNQEARGGLSAAARVPLEREERFLEDCRAALEEQATQVRACSAAGVLFQAALLGEAVDHAASYTPDRWSGEVAEFMRRGDRLVHSIVAFVEREAGLRCEDVFGDWYLNRDLDPHAAVEKALAATG